MKEKEEAERESMLDAVIDADITGGQDGLGSWQRDLDTRLGTYTSC